MNYREIAFDHFELLRKYVLDIYEVTGSSATSGYITIPNGEIGISITTRGSARILKSGKWHDIPTETIYGLTRTSEEIQFSPDLREITIGFHPYFLKLFFSEHMESFAGGALVSLYDVCGKSNVDQFTEAIHFAKTDHQALVAIERFLTQQLSADRINETTLKASKVIFHDKIDVVSNIAETLNVSGTTLRNLFREHIGLTPKELIRIRRVSEALKYDAICQTNLTRLSYQLGYFDQAHFIHDFKSVTGIAPRKYFKNEALTFDFYNFRRWQQDSFES